MVWVVTDDEVYVVAVAHNHRRPGYWRHRLEGGRGSRGGSHSMRQRAPRPGLSDRPDSLPQMRHPDATCADRVRLTRLMVRGP